MNMTDIKKRRRSVRSKSKRRRSVRRKSKRRRPIRSKSKRRRPIRSKSKRRRPIKSKSKRRQPIRSKSTDKKDLICNKPIKSSKPSKKKMVKACQNGIEKLVHFGATGYGHNYSPKARRSFRARHKCNTATDRLTARYWSCKYLWTKGGDSHVCPLNRKCKY